MIKTGTIVALLLLSTQFVFGEARFHYILITNDDGIEDEDRLLALAKYVSSVADRVSIIVPAFDRSGTSNHTTYGKHQSTLEITCKFCDNENGITVYTIPGNPADCVILGLGGFFEEDTPDLVLSGINGGSNIGPDWFGSGTIGAARMAAFLGVKAVALSGFEDHLPESFTMIPQWVQQLISSGLLDLMGKNTYLTIGFPEIPPSEIKGVQIAERKIAFEFSKDVKFKNIQGKAPHQEGKRSIWSLEIKGVEGDMEGQYDEDWLAQDYIIMTPMTINENQPELLNQLNQKQRLIPPFNR